VSESHGSGRRIENKHARGFVQPVEVEHMRDRPGGDVERPPGWMRSPNSQLSAMNRRARFGSA
jgi:hypothetical protein